MQSINVKALVDMAIQMNKPGNTPDAEQSEYLRETNLTVPGEFTESVIDLRLQRLFQSNWQRPIGHYTAVGFVFSLIQDNYAGGLVRLAYGLPGATLTNQHIAVYAAYAIVNHNIQAEG